MGDTINVGQGRGTYGALFSGIIEDIVVENKMTSEGKVLRLMKISVTDSENRKINVTARFIQPYKSIYIGMYAHAVVLSDYSDFRTLRGISDLFIPSAGQWFGDYPHLDKFEMRAMWRQIKQRQNMKRKVLNSGMKTGLLEENANGGRRERSMYLKENKVSSNFVDGESNAPLTGDEKEGRQRRNKQRRRKRYWDDEEDAGEASDGELI